MMTLLDMHARPDRHQDGLAVISLPCSSEPKNKQMRIVRTTVAPLDCIMMKSTKDISLLVVLKGHFFCYVENRPLQCRKSPALSRDNEV